MVARRSRRGTTLVEMLVVLAILGGTATVATLALRQPPGLVLDRALQGAAADLRLARAMAMAEGRPVTAIFDTTGRALLVPAAGLSRPIPAALSLTATGAAAAQAGQAGQGAGEGRIAVVFHPDGSSSGAEVLWAAGDRRAEMRVHWLTGEVRHARR